MSNVLLQLLKAVVAAMVAVMTPEAVKEVLDRAFDAVEKKVADTSTQWDDKLVLPILVALRKALDVPDD